MSHRAVFWLITAFLVLVAVVLLLLSPSVGVIFSLLMVFVLALVILLKPRLWDEVRPHFGKKKEENKPSADLFSEASRMILERCDQTDQRTAIVITHSPFVIGRAADCDHVVDPSMSTVGRHHCRIIYKEETGNYTLEDLGSRNGTFINSSRLAPNAPVLMRSGCMVALDKYQYIFKPYIEG